MAETAITEKVVTKVADREGVPMTELGPPLYRAINPAALDALVRSFEDKQRAGSVEVAFAYNGYRVTVRDDRTVRIDDGTDDDSPETDE
ncbi:HalOD1 output domain-containing protein [Natrialbaceae archaeon AArc-T1-2]|uniref:HalOD1 output domain-containing protein n=1 Tax=Natrialbaceae archaeon AArc-T1-2 TaxID=3053904 RepID=UPI00255AEE39|nr:HalOD1 output domain-containing protein [Natrialbaceae archaeon AArc-T1-2]WIV66280.1 hypothetical protein QQ977_11325 [Natrialbaceae archaeon AArc-T1-2]